MKKHMKGVGMIRTEIGLKNTQIINETYPGKHNKNNL
jgi:hypothetical protein